MKILKTTFEDIVNEIKAMQDYALKFQDVMSHSYSAVNNAKYFFDRLEVFRTNIHQYVNTISEFEEQMGNNELILSYKDKHVEISAAVKEAHNDIGRQIDSMRYNISDLLSKFTGEAFNAKIIQRVERRVYNVCDNIEDQLELLKNKADIVTVPLICINEEAE